MVVEQQLFQHFFWDKNEKLVGITIVNKKIGKY